MSGTATPPLAAAVADAGALGMIGIGRQPIAAVERYLDEIAALTSAPIGATCIAHFVQPEVVELVASRLPIIEFFYEWPDAARVPDAVVCGWQVGSVDEAKAAVDAGCQYVIAQGMEAGGHVRGHVALGRVVARGSGGRRRSDRGRRWYRQRRRSAARQWPWEPTPFGSARDSSRPASRTRIPRTSTRW